MNIFVFFVLSNFFKYFPELILFEKIVGWFFVDHIFEDYNFTAGKLFLVQEDYRSLIRNLTVLITSLCFFAQLLTPFEFIFVNMLFIFLFVIKTNKKIKQIFRFLVLMCYSYLIYTFLIVNVYLLFSLSKLIFFIGIAFSVLAVYGYILITLILFKSSVKKLKQLICIFNIKVILYIIVLKSLVFTNFFCLINLCSCLNNIVLDFVCLLLIPYAYLYYLFIVKFICQQLINFVKKKGLRKFVEIKFPHCKPVHKKKVYV